MPKQEPHPDHVKEAAHALYTRTPRAVSLQEVATFLTQKYGRQVHKVTVREWLKERGVQINRKRPFRYPPEVGEMAVKLYGLWKSIRKVRVRLHQEGWPVGYEWVRKELIRRGVKLRKPGRPRKDRK